jgi:hypothetical protein
MKPFIRNSAMLFLLAGVVLFHSCDLDTNKVETKPAESALEVLKTFSDVILTVDNGLNVDTATGNKKLMGKSYTETISGDYPNQLRIWDFGDFGDYQGLIKILLTDDYKNPMAVANVTFENFSYKGKPIDGMLSFENLGRNNIEQDEYNIELMEARVGDNRLTSGWMLQRTEGGITPAQDDDKFTISQIQEPATGITDEGVAFTLDIQKGLLLDLGCEFIITKGVFEMLFEGTILKAEFGDGECDGRVRVSDGKYSADIYIK